MALVPEPAVIVPPVIDHVYVAPVCVGTDAPSPVAAVVTTPGTVSVATGAATTSTATWADAAESAWLVAVTWNVPGAAGAVYCPVAVTVPPWGSTTAHVTAVFVVPVTTAKKSRSCCVVSAPLWPSTCTAMPESEVPPSVMPTTSPAESPPVDGPSLASSGAVTSWVTTSRPPASAPGAAGALELHPRSAVAPRSRTASIVTTTRSRRRVDTVEKRAPEAMGSSPPTAREMRRRDPSDIPREGLDRQDGSRPSPLGTATATAGSG
jgi:hypothetical protein